MLHLSIASQFHYKGSALKSLWLCRERRRGTSVECRIDLDYADDVALFGDDQHIVQGILNHLNSPCMPWTSLHPSALPWLAQKSSCSHSSWRMCECFQQLCVPRKYHFYYSLGFRRWDPAAHFYGSFSFCHSSAPITTSRHRAFIQGWSLRCCSLFECEIRPAMV